MSPGSGKNKTNARRAGDPRVTGPPDALNPKSGSFVEIPASVPLLHTTDQESNRQHYSRRLRVFSGTYDCFMLSRIPPNSNWYIYKIKRPYRSTCVVGPNTGKPFCEEECYRGSLRSRKPHSRSIRKGERSREVPKAPCARSSRTGRIEVRV